MSSFLISDIPYSDPGLKLTNSLHLPEEILMFGESGEYELMFTIHPQDEINMLSKSSELDIELFKIGSITENKQKLMQNSAQSINFNDFNIEARSFESHYDYIGELTQYLSNKLHKM